MKKINNNKEIKIDFLIDKKIMTGKKKYLEPAQRNRQQLGSFAHPHLTCMDV